MIEVVAEQQKVGKVHEEVGDNVSLTHAAVAAGQLRRDHKIVEVDAPDHLRDLQRGQQNVHPLGYLELHGARRIIRVHERVDRVVDAAEPASRAHEIMHGIPARDEHRRVMIPVQEDELLFA